jgi:integrase
MSLTITRLSDHFQQRELGSSNERISFSTNKAYQRYLNKSVVPRWGDYLLPNVKAVEVELWLNHLERAAGTRCKIRNLMSVLFNHARRYDLYDRNPIQWVRQSAKRRSAPDVLTSDEVRQFLAGLEPRERIMVLLDVATGLRQSELFALKRWYRFSSPIRENGGLKSQELRVTEPGMGIGRVVDPVSG